MTTHILSLGNELIAEVPVQTIDIDVNKEHKEMEYYYRRGNTYYFRDNYSKLTVSLGGDMPVELKRGHKYLFDMSW